jgi:hypothetical protein
VDAVQAALRSGLDSAMNLYNRKEKEPNTSQNSQQP